MSFTNFTFTFSPPATIAGCMFWFDASNASTLFTDSTGTTPAVSDGDAIGMWKDLSGKGNHVIQASGTNKPSLRLGARNNLNTIKFDGTSDYLSCASNSTLSSQNFKTAFVVAKVDPTITVGGGFFGKGTSDTDEEYTFIYGTNGYLYSDVGNNGGPYKGQSLQYTTNRWIVFSFTQSTVGGPSTTLTNYVNGVSTGGSTSGSGNTPNNNNGVALTIGARASTLQYMFGEIAEVIMYNTALSTTDRVNIENYLQVKWNGTLYANNGSVMYLDAGNPASYPGSGATWTDLSGLGNNATLSNSPTYSSSTGGYLTFNGSTQDGSVTRNANILTPSGFTLAVFATRLGNGNMGVRGIPVSIGYVYIDVDVGTGYPIASFDLNGSQSWFSSTTATPVNGTWVYYVITDNGSTQRFYMNGYLVGSSSVSGTIGNSTNTNLILGRYAVGSYYLNGRIAIAQAYNRVIKTSEVIQNFNNNCSRFGLSPVPYLVWYGLVLNWDASDSNSYPGTGNVWSDLTGNGSNGTITGTTTFSSANEGSFTFDGATYVDTSSNTGLLPTGGLTLCAWVKTSTANRFIIDKANSASTQGYLLAGGSLGGFGIQINNIGIASNVTITSNTWTYVVGTWVPSTSLTCYINGIFDKTVTASIPASITNPVQNLWVGKRRSNTDYWNGSIGNVHIYNRALSTAEIVQNYNATCSRFGLLPLPNIVKSGLVFSVDAANTYSYPGSGTAWRDLSGNSNDGILTNSPTFSSSNNGSFTFNGTTQFVDSSTNNGLLPTAGLTVCAWVKTSTANRFVFDKENSGLTQGYYLAGTSGGGAQFIVNAIGVNSSSFINTNVWIYVAGTWTPSTSLKFYINGVLDATNTTSIPSSITDPSVNLWLGKRRNGADMWVGSIANAQIYNRALSAAEVLQNFNALRGRYGV